MKMPPPISRIFLRCALISCFAISGCVSRQNKTVGSFPIQPTDQASLLPEDLSLLEAAIAFQQEIGDKVWPGFGSFRTATVYFASNGQFLFNAQSAPSYYKPYLGKTPS